MGGGKGGRKERRRGNAGTRRTRKYLISEKRSLGEKERRLPAQKTTLSTGGGNRESW